MTTMNRKHKDSVFVDLFNKPENQLRLYKVLHPEDTASDVQDIQDVTLRAVLMNGVYNDLGFTVGDRLLVLVEAQSTWSSNIAVRMLVYLGETYKAYLKRTDQNFYKGRPVHLPEPELYVVYTGEPAHEEQTVELGDVHWGKENRYVRLSVKVLYGGGDDILSQYTEFCRIARAMGRRYGSSGKAARATVRECVARNILADYLKEREDEVVDTMTFLFDQDYIDALKERTMRRDLREEMKDEVRAEVKDELRAELIDEVRAEVRNTMLDEIRAEVRKMVIDEFRAEAQEKILKEAKEKVRNEVWKEALEKAREEVRKEAAENKREFQEKQA